MLMMKRMIIFKDNSLFICLLFYFIFFFQLIPIINGFASYLIQEKYCNRSIEIGSQIMDAVAIKDKINSMIVLNSKGQMIQNSLYDPGDLVRVRLKDKNAGLYVFEIVDGNAKFSSVSPFVGCSLKRQYGSTLDSRIRMPLDGSSVIIGGVVSSVYGPVGVLDKIILNPSQVITTNSNSDPLGNHHSQLWNIEDDFIRSVPLSTQQHKRISGSCMLSVDDDDDDDDDIKLELVWIKYGNDIEIELSYINNNNKYSIDYIAASILETHYMNDTNNNDDRLLWYNFDLHSINDNDINGKIVTIDEKMILSDQQKNISFDNINNNNYNKNKNNNKDDEKIEITFAENSERKVSIRYRQYNIKDESTSKFSWLIGNINNNDKNEDIKQHIFKHGIFDVNWESGYCNKIKPFPLNVKTTYRNDTWSSILTIIGFVIVSVLCISMVLFVRSKRNSNRDKNNIIELTYECK